MRLTPLILFICSIIITSCSFQHKDVIYEDFEKATFDQWKIQGTALDKPYLADTINNARLKQSIQGSYFAYSHISDQHLNQGKLISPPSNLNQH